MSRNLYKNAFYRGNGVVIVGISMSNGISKRATLLLFVVLTILSLILVKAAPASAATTPSVPQFSVKYEANSYDVPPVYSVDRYTGESVITQYGYHVENKSVVITITNQQFTPYTLADGNVTSLSYNVRVKGHFEDGWTTLSHFAASDSAYTIISYALGGDAAYEILRNVFVYTQSSEKER